MIPVHHDFSMFSQCHSVFHGVPVPTCQHSRQSRRRRVPKRVKSSQLPSTGAGAAAWGRRRCGEAMFWTAWYCLVNTKNGCVLMCFHVFSTFARFTDIRLIYSKKSWFKQRSQCFTSAAFLQESGSTCCSFKRCNFPVQNVCFVWTPCIPSDIEFGTHLHHVCCLPKDPVYL